MRPDDQTSPDREKAEWFAATGHKEIYVLRLYISGMTPRSTEAIQNIHDICERFLHGHYELEIVDVYKHPEQARSAGIVATPTLVKSAPPPARHLVGTMSDTARAVASLGLIGEKE